MLLMTLAVAAWQCFSPVGNQIADNYDIKITVVNFLPSTAYIVQVCFAIPLGTMIEKRGASFSILFGSVMSTTGLLAKCLINHSFYVAVAGQCLISVSFSILQ